MDLGRTGVRQLIHFADLHLHSTASDGMWSPSEVVRRAAAVGLSTIALTDHDTIAGVDEAQAAGPSHGVQVIAGCEFSALDRGFEVHLLGYGMMVASPILSDALARFKEERVVRARRIVAAIAAIGIEIDFAAIERESGGGSIGRPHIARALMRVGVVRTVEEAFDRFLGRGRPGYLPKRLPAVEEVTSLVRQVGGVTILAHPKGVASRPELEALRTQGIDGIEVRHPSLTGPVRQELERLANELGLLRSGGSDSHGGEPGASVHRPIGEERIPQDWVDAILARSRERAPGVPIA